MKENKSKNLRKVLIILALIALLLSSAYAWFTSNKNASINGMQVSVQAMDGLEISTNGLEWKTNVSKTELLARRNYTSAVNQIPSTMYPVSSAGTVNGGILEMFKTEIETATQEDDPTNAGKEVMTATQASDQYGTNGEYIAFDVFMRVNSETKVGLNPKSVVKSGKTNYLNGGTTGIENCVRIAILNQGTSDASAGVQTIQGKKEATSAMILEPNYNQHIASGVGNAQSIYGISNLNEGTENEHVTYYGIKKAFSKGIPLDGTTSESDYFKEITSSDVKTINSSFFSGTDNQELFTLQPGITKLRVYIWLEGQDVDCENGASGAYLTTDLLFTAMDKEL